MTTVDLILSSDELEEIRQRLESYFGLANGDLLSEEVMERMQPPPPYKPQNSTGEVESVEFTSSAREQAIIDLLHLYRTAKVATHR